MNLFKTLIPALFITGIMVGCDDEFEPEQPSLNSSGPGLTEITFSSFDISSGPDANNLDDGTFVTVTPLAIGASSFVVNFGHGDPVTISENGGSASYDYPNVEASAVYAITVTAKSDQGLADVSLSANFTVNHEPAAVSTVPASPSERDPNVYALFSDGFEYDGAMLSWEHGTAASGGSVVSVSEVNDVVQFSRLRTGAGILSMNSVEVANTFVEGLAATRIHFDVHSNFSSGIDVLKVSLVNTGNSDSFEVDALALTDGEWTSFDIDLATGFSGAVTEFNEIHFELGSGGTARDHATIAVDNVYLHKPTSSTIANGDFNDKMEMWKFPTFTDGTTNPFGSSSDGSDLDYDGNDVGKTRGAKWSSSQSGGEFRSSNSRYAYQELALTPNANYILQYQYAIKNDAGDDPIGGRRVVGLIMDGYYVDGADAVDDIPSENLGYHEGFIAQGKFSSTPGDVGTFVNIPFTAPSDGQVSIMFYAVTPKDAYIDNVKVLAN